MTSRFEKQISIPEFNNKINPGDNFYLHINDKWLKTTEIPKNSSSYSVNEEIEDVIENDLYSIIDKCYNSVNKGEKLNSLEDNIGRFALSSFRESVQKNSISALKKNIQTLNCIRSIEDIGDTLGYFCKNNIDTILSTYLQLERTKNDKSIYTLYLSSSTLGLPDVTYYKATAPGKIKTLISYIQMVKQACKLLEIDDISDVISSESYYSAYIDKFENEQSILIKGINLEKMFHIIPWNNFFTSYGIDNWKKKSYRLQSKKYFDILQKSLIDIPLEQFKKLFKLHLILSALLILPSPYNTLYFDFYQNKLKGQKEKYSQKHLTLVLIKKHLSIPLSILYRKEFLENSLKKNTTKFIEKIRSSALKQIASNSWLQESTKKIAAEKVKNMTLSIGWPEQYYPLNLPNLQTDNLLENIYLLCATSTANDIKLLNTESEPGTTWEEPAFMVNAFYYNEINEFVVPAGSLLYPFYSDKLSIGWNYGGLGAVIGHEMVHAFDENGRDYDEHGLFKQWWLQIDNRRYNSLIKRLKELYGNSKIYGTHINGNKTVSENLADLGGVSIALEALKHELKEVSEKERINELRQFFISYAVSWRTKEEKKKVLQSLIIDKHSPPEFRVNNIVNQFDEWYEVFNVEVGNKMFVAPEARIRVF